MTIVLENIQDNIFQGYLMSPFYKDKVPFSDVLEMISGVEYLLDLFAFPTSAVTYRTFEKKVSDVKPLEKITRYYTDEEIFRVHEGKKASLILLVRFRQNATWQGGIHWLERNVSAPFNSLLQLFRLLDTAFSSDSTDWSAAGTENL